MLKKLRIKFIALIMVVVALVLAVSFTTICIIDYQQSTDTVYSALDSAISQAGEKGKLSDFRAQLPEGDAANAAGETMPKPEDVASNTDGSTDAGNPSGNEDSKANSGNSGSDYAPPEIGGRSADRGFYIPAAVYTEDSDGGLSAVEGSNTASIAEDVLSAASEEMVSKSAGRGTLTDLGLMYVKRSVGDTTYVAFADTSTVSSWKTLALTLAGVGIAALAVFFLVSVLFSRWALKPVQEAWSKQKQFVADASHDLKTPLTVILANTSILMEHPERSIGSESQWLESTQHEALGMQELVGDLLALAQLDEEAAGTIDSSNTSMPSKESIDFTDLIEGEMLQFESIAYEQSVKLSDSLSLDVHVSGNRQRLRRLVMTLIDNACKYAGLGGEVSVMLTKQGKFAILSVNNTGTVISEEDLPHIFDRFYRADKARTSTAGDTSDGADKKRVGGHGLGLAIAHAIAEEHGGTLTATSNEAEGTTFTAKLPLS